MISLIYGIQKKKKKTSEINEQTKKQKQTHGYREQSSVY